MTNDTTTAKATKATVPAVTNSNSAEPCLIKVTTVDIASGDYKEKIIDHGNFYDRKWLAKHCWWAMRNNQQVTTKPYSAGDNSSDGNNK